MKVCVAITRTAVLALAQSRYRKRLVSEHLEQLLCLGSDVSPVLERRGYAKIQRRIFISAFSVAIAWWAIACLIVFNNIIP